jgi:hypothetical protein
VWLCVIASAGLAPEEPGSRRNLAPSCGYQGGANFYLLRIITAMHVLSWDAFRRVRVRLT